MKSAHLYREGLESRNFVDIFVKQKGVVAPASAIVMVVGGLIEGKVM
jgi:hypothetical protein